MATVADYGGRCQTSDTLNCEINPEATYSRRKLWLRFEITRMLIAA